MEKGSSCSKSIFSLKGGKLGPLRGKRQVNHQKLGKRVEISRNSRHMHSPSGSPDMALIALNRVSPLGVEISLWQWSKGNSGLICAGAFLWSSQSWSEWLTTVPRYEAKHLCQTPGACETNTEINMARKMVTLSVRCPPSWI